MKTAKNEMVDLKPHNKRTYEKIKNILQSDNKTCAIQPTGSGKSYLILKLIEDYSEYGRDIIIIEPQKYIFDQLIEKIKEYHLQNNNIKFLTYSALGRLNDKKILKIKFPQLVIVDEMHRAGAPKWESGLRKMFDLFPDDCKYIGFSATPIRFLDGRRNMAEELFNGCIANEIGLADAILNRILPLPRYIAGLYTYDNEVNAINKKIMQSCNSEEEKKELLEEVKTMKNNLDKSTGISDIFKKYIEGDKGKYVAFCRNINHIKLMKPCLEKWFTEAGMKVNLYEVHYKNPEKDKQFSAFMEDDSLSICLSVGILSEGVHGIDGVILLRDTTSPNLYLQQLGRCFSVDMKSVPIIFDLVANCESIMDCSLKNDLLDAIEAGEKKSTGDKSRIIGAEKITKEDIEKFFVYDQVIDAIRAFKSIEDRLYREEWGGEEIENMKKYYPSIGVKCSKYLDDRTDYSIRSMAVKLGIKYTGNQWTEEEDRILLEYYKSMGAKCIKYLPDKNLDQIRYRAVKLNLREKTVNGRWTEEETDILINNVHADNLCELLPCKSMGQIKTKMQRLGLRRTRKTSKYKYVMKQHGKYIVSIWFGDHRKYFGAYDDEDEAGRVALEMAKQYGKIKD